MVPEAPRTVEPIPRRSVHNPASRYCVAPGASETSAVEDFFEGVDSSVFGVSRGAGSAVPTRMTTGPDPLLWGENRLPVGVWPIPT
ncbi:hypothetical protein COEX109129_19555 [Corallococcus exiguus]